VEVEVVEVEVVVVAAAAVHGGGGVCGRDGSGEMCAVVVWRVWKGERRGILTLLIKRWKFTSTNVIRRFAETVHSVLGRNIRVCRCRC
jgi:hypothetical protein